MCNSKKNFEKVNLTIELCAGKLTLAESPQRWEAKAKRAGTEADYSFEFNPDIESDTKPTKFYGGDWNPYRGLYLIIDVVTE